MADSSNPSGGEKNESEDDPTAEIREDTAEKLTGLEFNNTEATAAIVNYLPALAATLEGIRQELTFISTVLREEVGAPEKEVTEKQHDNIRDIIQQEHDLEMNRIISLLESISDSKNNSSTQ